jgi:hypothetical protein
MTMARGRGRQSRRWQDCRDAQELLLWLEEQEGGISERKRLLFGLACLRRVEDVLDDTRCRHCLDLVERRADGLALAAELQEARKAAAQARRERGEDGAEWSMATTALDYLARGRVYDVCRYAASAYAEEHCSADRPWAGLQKSEKAHQCALLRDLFGDPLQPGRVALAWRTPDALALAQAVYDGKAFDRLPILGDALEEAGCSDASVLGHCRDEGEHVKGCWVVDLVLGKS